MKRPPLKIIVCDDEKNARSIISASVKSIFEERGIAVEVETFSVADELLSSLKTVRYDLVFLDIRMQGVDGIELGRMINDLPTPPDIVFVSGNTDRMIETFALQPFGFVRKDKFLGDISSVIDRYVKRKLSVGKKDSALVIKDGSGVVQLNVDNIVYIEGQGNVQLLVFESGERKKIYSRLDALEERLSSHGFIRVHKGYLCNARFIKRFDAGTVTLTTKGELPVGRSKKSAAIKAWMAYVRRNDVGYLG